VIQSSHHLKGELWCGVNKGLECKQVEVTRGWMGSWDVMMIVYACLSILRRMVLSDIVVMKSREKRATVSNGGGGISRCKTTKRGQGRHTALGQWLARRLAVNSEPAHTRIRSQNLASHVTLAGQGHRHRVLDSVGAR